MVQQLRFFDAGLWLGPPVGFPNAEEVSPSRLDETMRAYHLTGGLVSHWRGKTLSAQDGNQALLEALDDMDEKVYAVLTGLPLLPGDAGPLPGLGTPPPRLRGVRLFPRSHNYPLTDWCVGTLCEWLINQRMPLFLWHTEIDWPSLYQLARTFPQLALVIETQVQKILYHTRPLFTLLRDCANVHVELSNFAGQGFIEYVAREVGTARLIYGSFLPMCDPWVPIGLILDARLTDEEKRLIAGDNLRRLVGTD